TDGETTTFCGSQASELYSRAIWVLSLGFVDSVDSSSGVDDGSGLASLLCSLLWLVGWPDGSASWPEAGHSWTMIQTNKMMPASTNRRRLQYTAGGRGRGLTLPN